MSQTVESIVLPAKENPNAALSKVKNVKKILTGPFCWSVFPLTIGT